ncbi:TasA family protein [uncultured Ruthenibacterium sp.]|uniref:TasA family protein n=1 Tax=uncultured Ruthenibacterium sp. TaxID=1905347 RepID=UPI00349E529F
MKRSKQTKRALGASVLAVVLCAAMLVGATFAWFTDSVTNTGNVITAGNLSIDAMAYDVDATGDKTVTIPGVNNGNEITFEKVGQDLKTDKKAIIGEELWEPGISSAKLLEVKNSGNLAAKIRLSFTTKNGGLQDALWFDFVQLDADGNVTGNFEKRPMSELNALAQQMELTVEKDETIRFVLVYGMKEEAGNEYKGKTFSADVSILATQAPVEKDGFNNDQYDAQAKNLSTQPLFVNAGENKTVDLDEIEYSASGYDGVFSVGNGGQLTVNGNGTVVANDVNNYAMAVWSFGEGSKVVINGGTYTNNIADGREDDQMDMIYASNGGDIEINGGVFKCVTPKWTLNIRDADYKSGASTIVVRGGTFFEYDPSHATNESPVANFVAEGYKVITEEKEDGTWYTVVPEE